MDVLCRSTHDSRGDYAMRVGVQASHQGTTLQALIDRSKMFRDALKVVVVITNNRNSGALERA